MATTARKDLTHLCRALKTPSLLASIDRLSKRARDENWSHEEFLAACLERELSSRQTHGGDNRIKAARFPQHKTLEIQGPQSSRAALLVEVRKSMAPRDIEALLGASLFKRLRAQVQRPIMVVAPYLSPRSRELLIEEDVGYLDMTGNLRLSIPYPALYLEAQGADTNPNPEKRQKRGLRGAQVGNLVRALVDVSPPYGVTELAQKVRVDPGYATRIFETLEAKALIERADRGRVVGVRWVDLLRQRASALDLLAPHKTKMFISQRGAAETRTALAGEEKIVVTGSRVWRRPCSTTTS